MLGEADKDMTVHCGAPQPQMCGKCCGKTKEGHKWGPGKLSEASNAGAVLPRCHRLQVLWKDQEASWGYLSARLAVTRRSTCGWTHQWCPFLFSPLTMDFHGKKKKNPISQECSLNPVSNQYLLSPLTRRTNNSSSSLSTLQYTPSLYHRLPLLPPHKKEQTDPMGIPF